MARTAKNQDLLQWALTGAAERLSALRAEMARIYQTFPSLRVSRPATTRSGRTATAQTRPRKRRRFSAEARAKLRASAKRRWAEAKKAGKKRLG